MLIRGAEYHKCESCGWTKQVSDDVYGCDQCGAVIDLNAVTPSGQYRAYLRCSVFSRVSRETQSLTFCSWRCCLKKLRTVSCDYFIDLPTLMYDDDTPGIRVADFWAAIEER